MSSKLTQKEHNRIKELQQQIHDKTFDYGRQRYIIREMKRQIEEEEKAAESLEQDIEELKEEHDRFANRLYKKYGDVSIDLETGEYYDRDEEAKSRS